MALNFVSCIITLCVIFIAVGETATLTNDTLGLQGFYQGLTYASQVTLVTWNTTGNACSGAASSTWLGVTCANGVVTRLRLGSRSLAGTISPSLAMLTSLSELNLMTNAFTGTVPPEIYKMRSLTNLRFSTNQLTGDLPETIETMPLLEKIYFNANRFTGTLPKVAALANTLNYFSAANNAQLAGSIPAEYGLLNKLTAFLINSCAFNGTIPASLGNLTLVTEFKLAVNQLTGTIPPELSTLDSCTSFHLYSNKLNGTIPASLGGLKAVQQFHVYSNRLTGTIPPALTTASTMTEFAAYSNQLTGSIPEAIPTLSHLTRFDVHDNKLSGTIPANIGDLVNLQTLYLSTNTIRGVIPLSVATMTSLTTLQLTDNQFKGSIPQALTSLPLLTKVELDTNQFEGNFPSAWQTQPSSISFTTTGNCWNISSLPDWVSPGYTQNSKCTVSVCQDGYCSASEDCNMCPQDCPSPCDAVAERNECLDNNGGCDPYSTCVDTPYSFYCGDCFPGFTGTGYIGCTDIDECASSTTNTCDIPYQTCINTPGSYNCSACATYTKLENGKCVDINECELANRGGCSQFRECINMDKNGSYCGPCPSNRVTLGNYDCSDPIDSNSTAAPPIAVIEYQDYNRSLYGGIAAIVAIGVCIAMFAVVMLAMFWTNFAKHGSFYCAVIVVGVFLSYVAALSVIPEHTDELCIVFPWFLGLAFSLVYGCLFLKTWTLYRIWMNATNFKRTTYTPFFILKLLAINVTVEIAYLIAWTVSDPPSIKMVKMVDDTYAPLCESDHEAWWAVFLGYKGLWLLFGAILSVLTRDVAKEYNESASIAYATYNNLVLMILGVPLALVLRKVPGGVEIIMVAVTAIAFTFTMVILFFDIWYQALFPDKSLVKMGSRTTSTYSAEMRSSGVGASGVQNSSGSASADSRDSNV